MKAARSVLWGGLGCKVNPLPDTDEGSNDSGGKGRTNGIQKELRPELQDQAVREKLLRCLPESRRECSDFELNCYYLMFRKRMEAESLPGDIFLQRCLQSN